MNYTIIKVRKKKELDLMGIEELEKLIELKDNRDLFIERFRLIEEENDKKLDMAKKIQTLLKKIEKTYIGNSNKMEIANNVAIDISDNTIKPPVDERTHEHSHSETQSLSGLFTIDTNIYNFLGIPKGSMSNKQDIAKKLIDYIKFNRLFLENSKIYFRSDKNLLDIFGEYMEETYSIFQILRSIEKSIST